MRTLELLIPGLAAVPVDTCPIPQPEAAASADAEVLAQAEADGCLIVDERTGAMHVYPKIPSVVAEAAILLGVFGRRVELANWLAGETRYRWWSVRFLTPERDRS